MSRTTASGCFEAGVCYLPVLALSPEVMLSHAWKPCQSRRLMEQPNTLHFQEHERLLRLFLNAEWGSASLQTEDHIKSRVLRGSSSGSSQQTPAYIQNSIQAKGTTPVSRVTPAVIPVWFSNWEKTRSKLHRVTDVLCANICFTSHKSASLTWFWSNHKTATEGGNCRNFSHRQWVITHWSLNIVCVTKSKLKFKATFKRH